MRLATIRQGSDEIPVRLTADGATRLDAPSLLEAIRAGAPPDSWPGQPLEVPGVEQRLCAPLRPGKIVAIGLNYLDHVRETGMALPKQPLIFAKFPSCVIGTGEAIVLPSLAPSCVDWEVELGVVIGRRMRDVNARDALAHVFGYTVANDVSARDLQQADGQWVRAKSFDTFCPLGPAIVTGEEIGDPQDVALETLVNGEPVQRSNTREMIFSVAEILAHCSACFPLDPGDLVLTGTPWGCGGFMDPPRALAGGDLVQSRVAGIGELRNPVVDAPAPAA